MEESQSLRPELSLIGWPLKSWPGFSPVSGGLQGAKELMRDKESSGGVSVLLKT